MATLEEYGDAASQVWGVALLVAMVVTLVLAVVFWVGVAYSAVSARRRRARARRRYSQEAIEQALTQLGAEHRARRDAQAAQVSAGIARTVGQRPILVVAVDAPVDADDVVAARAQGVRIATRMERVASDQRATLEAARRRAVQERES